ncbi:ABC-type nickel/cobalt efflux system permease component RcnA [Volucribacter psittacicida]|uniref:Nickel/cobalt efflux system n=1 Tax=Volucribacter psittacicida TaxID=203482 RepID=A0A4R1G5S9_9PAST|nr:zinc transporter permease subunit ZevB [Volucribacter psittacicida]TCK01880.1 ABC-type nickel/cobalt efflux system permease component RcnA [Volucribacter psittacicida]
MSLKSKTSALWLLGLLCLILLGVIYFSPWLVHQVAQGQKLFNQLISNNLQHIKQQPLNAGAGLILVSFLYGIFHALGPGHGKFIIASYLALQPTQMPIAMRLTLLSSLVQALVAIGLTSLVVVLLNLSSAYFRLSQLWIERIAFILLLLLGLYWCWQALSKIRQKQEKKLPQRVKIHQLTPIQQGQLLPMPLQSEVKNTKILSVPQCDCGHQHLPSSTQLQQAESWKSQALIVLSIGMRPCTGAIFVLFLAYMLDLYGWGILATLAMGIGTGITLSAFALLLQYARRLAVGVGKWYFSPNITHHFGIIAKFLAGIILIFFAISLFYSTTLPSTGGAILLGR